MLLITGPNGNVGSEIGDLLAAKKDLPYRLAARSPENLRKRFGSDVSAVAFDFADKNTWPGALDGIHTLFLMFPLPHPKTAKEWMVPFVEAAVRAGVRHIVYMSVPGGDKVKIPHYYVEKAVRESGIGFTILQPTYFAQNLTRDISTHWVDIAKYDEIFIPAKKGLHSFIDARDVGEAAVNVMRDPSAHRGRAYLLTGSENLDYGRVAEIMTEELGRPIRYSNPSFPRFWLRLSRRGITSDVLFFMTLTYMLSRFGKNAGSTDELPRLLGRAPRTMRDFIRDFRLKWDKLPEDAPIGAHVGRGPGWKGVTKSS